ncbi:MAG: hypothetical protein LKJ80_01890 [Oscillibacter sp.]|jgi:hypothetical protein|nr:hypothetical protein [Oscillibacter sp.]
MKKHFLPAAALLAAVLLTAALPAGCGRQAAASSSAPGPQSGGQAVSFRLNGYDCQVTLPEAWKDLCGTAVYDDGTGIDFLSLSNRDWGGVAFGIVLVKDGESLPDICDGAPVLLSADKAHGVSFYRLHPYTDVEYDAEDAGRESEYRTLVEGEEAVGASFTWKYTGKSAAKTPEAAAPQSASWKEAYQALLSKAAPCQYSIYDADGDGIPELLLKSGTCEADYLDTVYTFKNGAAAVCGSFSSGNAVACGLNGSGRLVVQNAHMGYEAIDVYTLKGGLLQAPVRVFEGELKEGQEYHPFTCLPEYPDTDSTGLGWTANASDANQSVLDSLS